ncbi:Transcriptional regulator, TetR family [Marinobacterium lacunae]|uniref:Transcriptional regulator, TetR family n=1 Tax=Marinobacterium lacunae TaxID=1232683 RepID=A0A081FXC3_9GAMM|nr:TetR/AcrR family transcriptional regulator [Marinobacterium lacunae]KEA63178.1 Transcriptional regulator, TetR family [Marinobacterium lacunae]
MANSTPRKQHLLDTAFRLFNERGYHATGIDLILAESGVSKATLYKHFASKEALILAVLEQRHRQLMESLEASLARDPSPAGVLVIFDLLATWFKSVDFFGCNFIRASGEYSAHEDSIHRFAAAHKTRMADVLEHHLKPHCGGASAKLASDLMLLIDGAIVAAQMLEDKEAAARAKEIARFMLDSTGCGQQA